jgi:hypothetical protein
MLCGGISTIPWTIDDLVRRVQDLAFGDDTLSLSWLPGGKIDRNDDKFMMDWALLKILHVLDLPNGNLSRLGVVGKPLVPGTD